MNYTTYDKKAHGAAMMAEAMALLRHIDAQHSHEDINEGPQERETRLRLRTAARQLVARMIKDLRASERDQGQVSFCATAW
ncbi:hypothetical protein [uncultured Thiodictyon sp.]|uniref:hypothetical protein n=1 Tax=uncultured Thiodictyon sp. TaxID=1846217 RepID=UPI0025FEDBE7|nr:hypothetical protein [uncultured Thiodictyon sp.]